MSKGSSPDSTNAAASPETTRKDEMGSAPTNDNGVQSESASPSRTADTSMVDGSRQGSPEKDAEATDDGRERAATGVIPARVDSIESDLQANLIEQSRLVQDEIKAIFTSEKVRQIVSAAAFIITTNNKDIKIAEGDKQQVEAYIKSTLTVTVGDAFKTLSASAFTGDTGPQRLLRLKTMSLAARGDEELKAQLAKFESIYKSLIERINAKHTAAVDEMKAERERVISEQVTAKAAEIQAGYHKEVSRIELDYKKRSEEFDARMQGMITELQSQSAEYDRKNRELSEAKDKLREDIGGLVAEEKAKLQEEKATDIQAMQARFSEDLAEAKSLLRDKHEQEKELIAKSHAEMLESLKEQYSQFNNSLKVEYAKQLQDLSANATTELKRTHVAEIEGLKSTHEVQVEGLNNTHAAKVVSLQEILDAKEAAMAAAAKQHETAVAKIAEEHKMVVSELAQNHKLAVEKFTAEVQEARSANEAEAAKYVAALAAKDAAYKAALETKDAAMSTVAREHATALREKDTAHKSALEAKDTAMIAEAAKHAAALKEKDAAYKASLETKDAAMATAAKEYATALAAKGKEISDIRTQSQQDLAAAKAEYQTGLDAERERNRQALEAAEQKRIHDKAQGLLQSLDFDSLLTLREGNHTLLEAALTNDQRRDADSKTKDPLILHPSEVIHGFVDYYSGKKHGAPDVQTLNMLSGYATTQQDVNLLVDNFADPAQSAQLGGLKENFLALHNVKGNAKGVPNNQVAEFVSRARKLGVEATEERAKPYFDREKALAVQYGWFELIAHYATACTAYASTKESYKHQDAAEKKKGAYGYLEAFVYAVTSLGGKYENRLSAYKGAHKSYCDLVTNSAQANGHVPVAS